MKARLFRSGVPKHAPFEFGAQATIGRGEACTVRLEATAVSAEHARIYFDAERGRYFLEDLGSLNGTRLDGARVHGRERLSGLHVLTFGETAELFFVELDRGPEEPEPPPTEPAGGTVVDAEAATLPPGLRRPAAAGTQVDHEAPTLPPGLQADKRREPPAADSPPPPADRQPPPVPPGAARWVLVVELPDEPVRRFALTEGDNPLGRAGSAAVRLEHRELSRRHAVLRVAGERIWVRDEGSRNKTFVAGEAITAEVELTAGARLRFGTLAARVEEAADG